MKKLLIILLCCLILAGCGKAEGLTGSGSVASSAEDVPESAEPLNETEPEYINGFEKADYEKFNVDSSGNDLEGTEIYVQGTVKEIAEKDNNVEFIIEQNDDKQWTVFIGEKPLYGNDSLKSLLNKNIEIFGEYIGYFDMPNIGMGSIDGDYYIVVNEKDKLTKRNFYSNMKELRKWYKDNSEEIFLSDCSKKKNRKGFKTSTGVITYIHKGDDTYTIDFVQKLKGKYSAQSSEVGEMILCDIDTLAGLKVGDGLKSYYYVDSDGLPNLLAMEKVKAKFKLSDYKKNVEKTYKSKCKEYKYEKIARNPKKVKGKFAKLSGEVIKVMEDGNSVALRVNITKSDYGFYSDTVYVTYERKGKNEDRILEDDIITIYGELAGMETYTSVLGAEVSLPKINAKYIEMN